MRFPPELIDRLAAEHVLGTLRGAARRRFERLVREDDSARQALERWSRALTPLAMRMRPVEPPHRVWRAITARIAPREPARAGFWRGLALLAGGMACVLAVAFVSLSTGPRSEPLFVAVLTEQNASPRMVLSMHQPGMLRVRMVKPWAGMRNQSLELWAMPAEGAPRSLGLVANEMRDTMIRIAPDDPRVQGVAMFAITMEPAGGSPSRQPTGSIVCSGPMAPVRRG
jgi:anti-sigma-K factor RskA